MCAPPTGDRTTAAHQVAGPGCECGFYAYGSVDAALRNRHTRYVQAVVSCWGSVVVGTQGVRAEQARIDALWLDAAVPPALRARVAQRYPSARMYATPAAMLAEHPLSTLPGYTPPTEPAARVAVGRGGGRCAAARRRPAAVAPARRAGTRPVAHRHRRQRAAGRLVAGRVAHPGHVPAAVVVGRRGRLAGSTRVRLVGWLLRLPVLRALLVAGGARLLALRRGYFPVVRAPRRYGYRAVRL